MILRSILSAFLLVAFAAGLQAGTIVWDFDSTDTLTANLEAGAVDGDMIDQWRQNVGYTDLGLEPMEITNGALKQTYANLTEGQLPYELTGGGIHGTGIQVGNFGFDWGDGILGVELDLADVANNYPYLMIGGNLGWSTNTTVGGIMYCVFAGELWFANNYRFTNISTNDQGLHVVDLTSAEVRAGIPYGGELDAIIWDVWALWFGPGIDPAGMATQWPAEFDNDPNVTFLNIDWIALTDDPSFRSGYVPVELSEFSLE